VGKTLGVMPKGSAPGTLAEALLRDGWGIYDQVKISYHRPPDLKDILLTGTVDAVIIGVTEAVGGKYDPPPYALEILGARKAYWLDVTPEAIDNINRNNPWKVIRAIVPKGASAKDAPPEDVGAMRAGSAMTAWDVTPDEVAYELVKFMDENAAEWSKRNTGRKMGAEFLAFYPGLTEEMVHPGALRYFKEKGIKIKG